MTDHVHTYIAIPGSPAAREVCACGVATELVRAVVSASAVLDEELAAVPAQLSPSADHNAPIVRFSSAVDQHGWIERHPQVEDGTSVYGFLCNLQRAIERGNPHSFLASRREEFMVVIQRAERMAFPNGHNQASDASAQAESSRSGIADPSGE